MYVYIYIIYLTFVHLLSIYTYYKYLCNCNYIHIHIYLFIDRYTVYTTSIAKKTQPSFCCAVKVAHHPNSSKSHRKGIGSQRLLRLWGLVKLHRIWFVSMLSSAFAMLGDILMGKKSPSRFINLGMKLWMIVKGWVWFGKYFCAIFSNYRLRWDVVRVCKGYSYLCSCGEPFFKCKNIRNQ